MAAKRKSVQRRSSRDVSTQLRKDYQTFRRRGFSHLDATRLARQEGKMVGHIGDVNWIDHGGGPVYRDNGGYTLDYVVPPQEGERQIWEVYSVSMPDPEAAKDYLRDGGVQRYTGRSTREYLAALRSKNPLAEAQVWEDIAGFYGWHEVDQSPARLNRKAITLRFGEEPSE